MSPGKRPVSCKMYIMYDRENRKMCEEHAVTKIKKYLQKTIDKKRNLL